MPKRRIRAVMAGFVFTVSGLVAAGTLGKQSHDPNRSSSPPAGSSQPPVPRKAAIQAIADAYCTAMIRCNSLERRAPSTQSTCTDHVARDYGTALTNGNCGRGVDAGELDRYISGLRELSCSDWDRGLPLTNEAVRRLCTSP